MAALDRAPVPGRGWEGSKSALTGRYFGIRRMRRICPFGDLCRFIRSSCRREALKIGPQARAPNNPMVERELEIPAVARKVFCHATWIAGDIGKNPIPQMDQNGGG